jgi:hypothetical protein
VNVVFQTFVCDKDFMAECILCIQGLYYLLLFFCSSLFVNLGFSKARSRYFSCSHYSLVCFPDNAFTAASGTYAKNPVAQYITYVCLW